MTAFTFDADKQLIKSDDKNVRIILVGEGKRDPWFRGNDVANLLGYSEPKKAVSALVKPQRTKTLRELLDGGGQPGVEGGGAALPPPSVGGYNLNDLKSRYVNESGLYELAIKSKVPAATEFQDWIIDEVLPSIRKSGQYTMAENPLSYNTAEIERQYIYVAVVQEEPIRIGKYGRTTRKTEERFVENRRKYTEPYFFHPLIVMEVDDAVKAERVFSKLPDIADNKHAIKTNVGTDNETFVIPPTLTTQKLHFLMRKAAAASISKDLLMGHFPAEDKDVTLAKLELETLRLNHEYRMEVLKRDHRAVGVTEGTQAKKRKVSVAEAGISEDSFGEETNMDIEEGGGEFYNAGDFDGKVEEFVRSLCEFGNDERAARSVDRFRTDKVFLHREFVKLHGPTSPSKFYAACQKLEGIEPVTVRVEDRHIRAFSGIRLKERVALLSGEILMKRYLEEKCDVGDDAYCIGKSEFYENFINYAKQFANEDAMTYKHGFSANAFNKFLTSKEVLVSKTTWRGVWGKIYVGIRPNAGYPTVDETITSFLERDIEHMEGANVGRPKLLSALTKFTRLHYGMYPLRITGEVLTAHLAAIGVGVVMINRNHHFANITLREK